MSYQYNLGIFGGDLRQVYITENFLEKGYHVCTFRIFKPVAHKNCTVLHTLNQLFDQSRVVIGPIPFTKDLTSIASANELNTLALTKLLKKKHILIGGIIPSPIAHYCSDKGIPFYDLMKDEKITILNAVATAEGSIMEAIKSSEINLHGCNCLVLGYGRCAKILSAKLKAMDAKTTIAARSETALAYAQASGHQTVLLINMEQILPSCHFIFNTIPAMILDRNRLELVNPKVTIIDIASAPGGVDYEYAMMRKLNAKLCPGLPGKVSPRSTAEILTAKIDAFIKERSD